MKQKNRQQVLRRDNYKCRNCHLKDYLQVHHIISEEECKIMGVVDKEFGEILDKPEHLITLCVDCHSTTFFSGAPSNLFTPDEKDEQVSINKKWKQLEFKRRALKREYNNLWNTESYQSQKHTIDKSFEELDKRRKDIRENGLTRLNSRRQEVIKLC
ncbi:HNH endonuclease [Chloroflexota bacterium]